MNRSTIKRETDLQIIGDWIQPESRVLDLGCGEGVLLEYLKNNRNAYAVGVDSNQAEILACIKRGVNAYQGDILAILNEYPDGFFDWVICSRTVQVLHNPSKILFEALRVGKHCAVGFINAGFWINRASILLRGSHVVNEVYPEAWYRSDPSNPVSIHAFERFCSQEKISVARRVFLDASWRKPCGFMPNLFAGYAIYDISR